jgi:hypothetical protein
VSRPRYGVCRTGKTATPEDSGRRDSPESGSVRAFGRTWRNRDDYSQIGSKIVMIEFGVAVATVATYTVKRIDNDFFEAI